MKLTMKYKNTTNILITVMIAIMTALGGSLSSCSTLHGHWGIGGEYPGYGYDKPAPPHQKPHKNHKNKKNDKQKHNRSDWWDD